MSPAKLETLERNWRRVASTHTLQDLLDADKHSKDGGIDIKLLLFGLLLILCGIACLVLGIFAFGAEWLLPPSKHTLIKYIQEDRYYHLLIPAMVPVTIIMIFINWFSMKIFKHNS